MAQVFHRADIHIHSRADDGLATPAEIVEHATNLTDLDMIAITDHDAIAGALEAREDAARRNSRILVVVGMEITTREGHLLALGIEKPVRMLQPMSATIDQVHAQGGLCILPHPLAWFSMGARSRTVDALSANGATTTGNCNGTHLDGLEVFNPSFAGRVVFDRVKRLNESRWKLPECGGSDSHALHTIGSAYTTFPGDLSLEAFRLALGRRETGYEGQFWSVEDHTSIALPQLYRSMLVTPIARVRRSREWLRDEEKSAQESGSPTGVTP